MSDILVQGKWLKVLALCHDYVIEWVGGPTYVDTYLGGQVTGLDSRPKTQSSLESDVSMTENLVWLASTWQKHDISLKGLNQANQGIWLVLHKSTKIMLLLFFSTINMME